MTIKEIFYKRLRQERERRGWSQAELSRRVTALGCELKKDVMSKIESGDREVKLVEAVALAATLNVPLPVLLFENSSEELALADKLRVRMPLTAAWLVGTIPLRRDDDVKHYEAARVRLARARVVQDELADLFKEQPPNEHEAEMVRALARMKRARAGLLDAAADVPDAPGPEGMRDAARQHRQEADEIEQLLPEEEK
jgi:transcriptional regulator with XRE-family HTH domain